NTLSVDQVRQDLEYLYRTLEAAHYDLYAHTPKAVFEKEYRRIQSSVRAPLTILEAHRLFQRFAALPSIGHCRLEFPYPIYDDYSRRGGVVFPFDVAFRGEGRVVILRDHSGNHSVAPGDQLLSIDGEPVNSVLEQLYEYTSGERMYLKQAALEMISLPRKLWYTRGTANSYEVVLAKPDGSKVQTLAKPVPASRFEMDRKNIEIFDLKREFKFIDGVAYLKPGPFYNFSGPQYFDTTSFDDLLASAFAQVRQRNSRHLILDLRNNPGGESFFSDRLVAYFATKPFHFASKFHLRTSRVSKENFSRDVPPLLKDAPPTIAREVQRQLKAVLSHPDGERFEFPIPEHPIHPEATRFTGDVHVLINRHSYSNATTTAALMQDYGFGTLVGEETADLPTTYASISSFTLPRSNLRVTYPRSYFVRPSGDRRVRGVTPDYVVSDDVLTGEDEVLNAAVRRAKVQTR
ncbi:MAG TPA: S41 family peptidase, partial [Bryobacteraceae bacterium]|nr:S41 family peptidase [Bryobacteraceae bacterium]